MKLKDFIRETARQVVLGDKASSQAYVRHLEKIGVTVGTDVTVYAPNKTMIDEQYPWMIRIGNHVRIAEGVKILTHDFSWSVIKGAANREMRGAILGCCKPVDIGNNVFIGVNAVLLGGTHIGDDVVIGAGSVVTGDISSGVVAAGVPARVKCTLEEYYRKRREQQMEEAAAMARGYKEKFGVIPPPDVFHEFLCFSRMKRF